MSKIIELDTQIGNLNVELGRKSELIEDMNGRFKSDAAKGIHYFDEQEAMTYFGELLRDKEDKLKYLASKMDDLR